MHCSGYLPFALRFLPLKARPYAVLCAVIFVHLPLGSAYIIGNLIPYIESYRYCVRHHATNAGDMSWFVSCLDIASGVFGVIAGIIDRKYGPRTSIFCGSVAITASTACTRYALQGSLLSLYFTYVVLFGVGFGLCSSVSLACVIRWLPANKGIATAAVSAAFALSPLALNMIATYYINPLNERADLDVGAMMLFRNTRVLERIPLVFFLLAGIYAMCQFGGLLFVCNPTEVDYETIEENKGNLKPAAMIKTQTFYAIMAILFSNCFGTIFITTYYKAYGLRFIQDDHFLSVTGSISFAANAAGRLFWGNVADRFSYQNAIVCSSALQAMLFFTFDISRFLRSKAVFFVWVNCIYFAMSSNFVLHGLVTADLFGQKHFAFNFALVTLATIASAVSVGALATGLLEIIRYTGFFFICGALSTVAFVVAMLFHRTDRALAIGSEEIARTGDNASESLASG